MAESGRVVRVLHVEDDDGDALLVARALREGGLEARVEVVDNAAELDAALSRGGWDVVLSDYNLPGLDGLAVVRRVLDFDPDLPCIVVSGAIGETVAVEAVLAGARDYVMKDFLQRLAPAVQREIETARQGTAKRRAERALVDSELRYRAIVDDHPEMIVRWRPDGTIAVANRTYARLSGCTPADLTGRSFLSGLDDEQRADLLARVAALSAAQPVTGEERTPTVVSDGGVAVRHHSWTHHALFDTAGQLREVQSVGRDVTELRELEALDRRQRRVNHALRDTAAVLATTLDLGDALARLLANLAEVVPHDAAAVLLEGEDSIRVSQASGRLLTEGPATLVGSRLNPAAAAALGLVTAGHGAAVVADTALEPSWPHSTEGLAWVGSAAGAPLAEDGRVFGYLVVLAAASGSFTEDSLRSLEGFADYAAAAVRKAQIFAAETSHRQRLQRLSTQIEEVHEGERRRISTELHDEVGQSLTAVAMNLQWVLGALNGSADARVVERLRDSHDLTAQVMRQVRELSHSLRPTLLDDLGLESALRWFLERFERWCGVRCTLEVAGLDDRRLPREVETAFYRIVQEALTNVVKHADARSVRVCLERTPRVASLLVVDDGCGLDLEQLRRTGGAPGIGLTGMRERLASVGGHLRLRSAPGQGLQLLAEVPVARPP